MGTNRPQVDAVDRRIIDRVLERIWEPGVLAHEVPVARGAVVVPHRGKVLLGKAVILAPRFQVCLGCHLR